MTPRPRRAAPAAAGRRVRALAALAALVWGLSACGSAVAVTIPSAAASGACTAAAALWPTDVSGLAPVETSPRSPGVRAWGDPPVIARCGVASPGPSTDCLTVDDVDWVVTQLTDGAKFVTFGRSPALEVLVPSSHVAAGNEGSLLPVFSPAARALPTTGHTCSD